jgi:hypothetical protein
MDDQRVGPRPALRGKDGGDGRRVPGVGAEAIDRFRRQGDDAAGPEQGNRLGNPAGIGRNDARFAQGGGCGGHGLRYSGRSPPMTGN